MGNAKRWRTLGGGEFYKFDTPGQTLEGVWRGTRPGKFGDNGTIEQPDGSVAIFTLNATLKDLIHVKPGCDVKIIYTGKNVAKNGNQYKAFTVQVSDDAEIEGDGDDSTTVPF